MTKLLIATSFAVVAIVATPVSACEWNREASTQDPAVAAAPASTEQTTTPAAAAQPKAPSVAADESARKGAGEPAPIVLVTERH